ncbi:MAG: hypothetical protein GXX08_11330 [Firmicutes bacterium]|nr:hypothetical protein [Bacillota bacterium]
MGSCLQIGVGGPVLAFQCRRFGVARPVRVGQAQPGRQLGAAVRGKRFCVDVSALAVQC